MWSRRAQRLPRVGLIEVYSFAMSDEASIQVNFGKPMPLFPLNIVSLLPQQVLPLHVFEPRYRQLFERVLDSSGQLAMAVFAGDAWKTNYQGRPPLRRAVCIGHIVQHERLPDGRLNVFLQGICRARILREMPAAQDRLYRAAILEPYEMTESDPATLAQVKLQIRELLERASLKRLVVASTIAEWLVNDEVPDRVLLELISLAVIHESDARYQLLSEPDAAARAEILITELRHLDRLIRLAAAQEPTNWPKGCSWN